MYTGNYFLHTTNDRRFWVKVPRHSEKTLTKQWYAYIYRIQRTAMLSSVADAAGVLSSIFSLPLRACSSF